MNLRNQITGSDSADPAWQALYTLAGVAALLAAVLTLSEVIVFAFYPQPGTIRDWFMRFQSNPLLGLVNFWGLEVPMYLMFALVFLALYVLLRNADEGRMAIAITLALLGLGIFLATNNPFSMLSLSRQYAAAATGSEREMLLAAGQALLASTGQRAVGGFNLGLFLVSLAGLIVSSVMLRSHVFGRWTAYLGLLAHALSLADYLRQALTSSAMVALLVILPNALFLVIWYVSLGRRLYQLGQLERRMLPRPRFVSRRS
ncbi:MAG TPA: DUF4386 family protein [Anaerolineales bacterium]